MGDCKFCGGRVGWLRYEHTECRAAHEQALVRMRELAARAATTGSGLDDLREQLTEIATGAHIGQEQIQAIIHAALEAGLDSALDDHTLTDQELRSLNAYQEHFDLTPSRAYRDRVRKAVLLTSLMERGSLPAPDKSNFGYGRYPPFNLLKSESLLWLFEDVEYFTEVTRRHFVAGSSGMSFRVAKGVYFRTSGSRGRTVSNTTMEVVDTGLLGITTKHLYFKGEGMRGKSFRIRLNRIVSFEPYEDAVGVMRDTQSAKPEAFRTGDGWFATNLLRAAAYAMEGDGFQRDERTLDEIMTVGFPVDTGGGEDFLIMEGEM